jgi:protein-histidine N-methyltransferase
MQKILESRSLSCVFQIPISCSATDAFKSLDRMIQAARIVHMDEVFLVRLLSISLLIWLKNVMTNRLICVNLLQLELYFAGDDYIGPFSARNELESLNLLFKIMKSLIPPSNAVAKEVMERLKDEIVVRLRSVGETDDAQMIVQTHNHDAEDSLLKWGEHHGVKTKIQIACKSPFNMHVVC